MSIPKATDNKKEIPTSLYGELLSESDIGAPLTLSERASISIPPIKWWVKKDLSILRDTLEQWWMDNRMSYIVAWLDALGRSEDFKSVLDGTWSMTLQNPEADGNWISPIGRRILTTFQDAQLGAQARHILWVMKKYNITEKELNERIDTIEQAPLAGLYMHGARTYPEIYWYHFRPESIAWKRDHRRWVYGDLALRQLIEERTHKTSDAVYSYLKWGQRPEDKERLLKWEASYATREEAEKNKPDITQYPEEIAVWWDTFDDNIDFLWSFPSNGLFLAEEKIVWQTRYYWTQSGYKISKWWTFWYHEYISRYFHNKWFYLWGFSQSRFSRSSDYVNKRLSFEPAIELNATYDSLKWWIPGYPIVDLASEYTGKWTLVAEEWVYVWDILNWKPEWRWVTIEKNGLRYDGDWKDWAADWTGRFTCEQWAYAWKVKDGKIHGQWTLREDDAIFEWEFDMGKKWSGIEKNRQHDEIARYQNWIKIPS